jgi:bifunctional DNA-binding transcriptional regulator/antitoxin component of YhaV-PrlF toxin-antitoxin module
MKLRTRISRGGQISIPAAVRRRWATDNVLIEDSGGDELVLRPLPADPIDAAIGSLPLPAGLTAERLRARARTEERRRAPVRRGRS